MRARRTGSSGRDCIIVALESVESDSWLADEKLLALLPHVGGVKVGSTSIHRFGCAWAGGDNSSVVTTIADFAGHMRERGLRVFYDPKLADTKDTVAMATADIVQNIAPWAFTIHASMPDDSISAAVENKGTSNVIGVTILTSFSREECERKFGASPGTRVVEFARDLARLGADGLVCSPLELGFIASEPGLDSLIRITPGVRPAGSQMGQQKRAMTPGDAIRAGADYLVIGGPIMNDHDPAAAAQRIADEVLAAEANLSEV